MVRDYIKHYSAPGDKVLDPFGGSGVTAIEAYLTSRTGFQNDINPLANFIADGLYFLSKQKINLVQSTFANIMESFSPQINLIYSKNIDEIEANWEDYMRKFSFPVDIVLPKNSDVSSYYELFTKKQLLSLAIMKSEVDKIENKELRHVILLAWSATLSQINKTFLSAEGRKESRGGSSIFSIYRYKIAARIIELNPLEVFANRVKNILRAHKEILAEKDAAIRKYGMEGGYFSSAVNATELGEKFGGQMDYIFTDPPYGGHIAYLDLSILWNLWLGNLPTKATYENELIVGGEIKHSEEYYIENLAKSIKTISGLLKDDRCFSVVFQHKNVKYFEAILDAALESNSKLIASIPQGAGTVWSMHKKKGKHSVIAGEFILTFQKSKVKIHLTKTHNISLDELVSEYLGNKKETEILSEEEIFNDLIVLCWQRGLTHELSFTTLDIPQKLSESGFSYDTKNHTWKKTEQSKIQMEFF